MFTSNAAPMLANRTANHRVCNARGERLTGVRHEVRAERRYEEQRWRADLAAELSPEPAEYVSPADLRAAEYAAEDNEFWLGVANGDFADPDYDPDPYGFIEYGDPDDDDEVAAWLAERAERAEQAATDRATRIAERYTLDPCDLPGWDAPTVLVFNDWQDNDTVGIYGLESGCIL